MKISQGSLQNLFFTKNLFISYIFSNFIKYRFHLPTINLAKNIFGHWKSFDNDLTSSGSHQVISGRKKWIDVTARYFSKKHLMLWEWKIIHHHYNCLSWSLDKTSILLTFYQMCAKNKKKNVARCFTWIKNTVMKLLKTKRLKSNTYDWFIKFIFQTLYILDLNQRILRIAITYTSRLGKQDSVGQFNHHSCCDALQRLPIHVVNILKQGI